MLNERELCQRFSAVVNALIARGIVNSVNHLAIELGYTKGTALYKIINKVRKPPLDKVMKICQMYGVDGNYFFGKSEDIFINKRPLPGRPCEQVSRVHLRKHRADEYRAER